MKDIKYGLLEYTPNHPKNFNLGDYIQSLAARQYLPAVDTFVSREELSEYQGDQIKLIMNGWFMHQPEKWPPSKKIEPLYVSFHIRPHLKEKLLNKKGIFHLKNYEPIGCRDMFTVRALEEKGVDAYYSGCLTTTLDLKYSSKKRTDNIYIVDPFVRVADWNMVTASWNIFLKNLMKGNIFRLGQKERLLKKLFTKNLLEKSKKLTHMLPQTLSHNERFTKAREALERYATAKLVITSRIHCALPCLALGTPVIFLKYRATSYDNHRFDGLIDLFNTIYIDKKMNIKSNFYTPINGEKISENINIKNFSDVDVISEKLKNKCFEFIGK